MILEWLAYGMVVSLLVGLAAWLAEQGALAQRWRVRWIWAGALAVSTLLPLGAWLRPGAGVAESGVAVAPGAYVLQALPLGTATVREAGGPALEAVILWGWGSWTALLLMALAVLAARLQLRRRRWPVREVDGVKVLVSRATGPAAIGVVRGRVVVPEWALGLDERRRQLLVLHEAEHVRAGDPRLALAGLMVCALVPWNLPLWWQLRRLRVAIEMDCDARVMRRAAEPRLYGSLLLAVGQRKSHLALALAESPTSLERRIRMIVENRKGRAWVRGGILAAMAGVVLALACETPGPAGPASPDPEPAPEEVDQSAMSAERLAEKPTFTPFSVRPEVKNTEEVQQALREQYPPLLRDAGIGGTVQVWFFIDETGRVVDQRINKSSGHEALDDAALRVAERMAFTPAYNRDEPVPAWVSFGITFQVDAADGDAASPPDDDVAAERRAATERALAERAGAAAADAGPRDGVGDPTFTPMTVRPQVQNVEEVQGLLQERYPPLLKNAGIGGTAQVWFFIDETGQLTDVRLNQSSGHQALDEAALSIAREMEFSPAKNRDKEVPVWVSFSITFEAD